MISPGMNCCEHTLNTLRYADRYKVVVILLTSYSLCSLLLCFCYCFVATTVASLYVTSLLVFVMTLSLPR